MKYFFRFSQDPADIREAQVFRGRLFRDGEVDGDPLDTKAIHGLIFDAKNRLVCTFRMLAFEGGKDIDQSYSAQFYNLERVKDLGGKSLELGRFCVDPELNDPDILRLAWAKLTEFVFENDIDLLFGCSSFKGAHIQEHTEALVLLKDRYLAPEKIMPRIKAPRIFEFAKKLKLRRPDLSQAQRAMPPLLRSYLMMGGWVSDHAVIDNDLNTVHVFTGLEISRIPLARRKIFSGLLSRLQPAK